MARKDTILTFEEITYVADIFVSLGIEKIRLTGGEPMLRRGIEGLIESLGKLKNRSENPKLKDLALTTNGFAIKEKAKELKSLGLDRLTISLDSLKRDNFVDITGVDKLHEVLEAIQYAKAAGLEPLKINAVVVRDRNDGELVDFAKFAAENAVSIRFIEFMPLDSGHDWNREMVVSGKEIFETINAEMPLELKSKSRGAETAWNYTFKDGSKGEIGIIAPVTQMFCGACSRIRLTSDGQIRTCLFSTVEHNLRDVVRTAANRNEVVEFIQDVTLTKEASHQINDKNFVQPSRTMSFIGG
jgi:cyclic pyranopterin phosphate synthase